MIKFVDINCKDDKFDEVIFYLQKNIYDCFFRIGKDSNRKFCECTCFNPLDMFKVIFWTKSVFTHVVVRVWGTIRSVDTKPTRSIYLLLNWT